MRRSIAIVLLGIFASHTMEAHQLLKVPALVEHLSEHQADGPMSWAEFLVEHYVLEGHHDDQAHPNLPFHCDNQCATQTTHARLPDLLPANFALLGGLELEIPPREGHMPGRDGLNDVWQPPRA